MSEHTGSLDMWALLYLKMPQPGEHLTLAPKERCETHLQLPAAWVSWAVGGLWVQG